MTQLKIKPVFLLGGRASRICGIDILAWHSHPAKQGIRTSFLVKQILVIVVDTGDSHIEIEPFFPVNGEAVFIQAGLTHYVRRRSVRQQAACR